MKKFINKISITALTLVFTITAFAQENGGSDRISLTSYIAPEVAKYSAGASTILTNKLNQVVNANGLGGNGSSRFIITANVIELSKDVIASAPPSIVYTLDVTLYIGDGMDGKKYASHTLTLKGVGQNENKAMIDAIKSIKPNDPAIQAFVTVGKTQIVEYYNARCEQILKEAKLLEAQNRFEEAIFVLTAVPDASLACYNKAIDAIVPIYNKYIDRDCKIKLQEATAIWNANQSVEAANEVGQILMQIDPQAACYADVRTFSNKIANRVLQLQDREWNFKVDSEIGLKRDVIKAYRDVGVAYGKGQPKTVVYNTRGWW